VEIGAINLYPQPGAQDLDVTFYNQYGLPMNPLTMTLQLSAFSPQKPAEVFTMKPTATSVTISGVENLVVNDTVNLFVVDNNTAQAATKTVTVVAAPTISAFSFGELTIAGSATRILTGTSGHLISVNAYDQYGNSYKLRTGNQDISTVVAPTIPLLLISSDKGGISGHLSVSSPLGHKRHRDTEYMESIHPLNINIPRFSPPPAVDIEGARSIFPHHLQNHHLPYRGDTTHSPNSQYLYVLQHKRIHIDYSIIQASFSRFGNAPIHRG
jgi:hypothetical protein